MGEYAKRHSDGAEVKIGTCEDMYYLRAGQRSDVDYSDWDGCRFRFPWPDEDGTLPGEYREDYNRSLAVDFPMPPTVDHGTVQFSARAGYLISVPCPESGKCPVKFHRNGFTGAVHLTQQRVLADGRLVPVLMCGGCGAKWRLEDAADIQALAVAFRVMGDKNGRKGAPDARRFHEVADRILAGAMLTLQLVTQD